jgi:hypothetical protein
MDLAIERARFAVLEAALWAWRLAVLALPAALALLTIFINYLFL